MKNLSFPICIFTFLILLSLPSYGQKNSKPNIIVIFADDLGYGDLGCYGHPTIQTPYLDQMAAEGMRFTQFYVGADVCTPSRAALLTGRLPIRFGMAGEGRGVLFPDSGAGLPHSEVTIASLLKEAGYSTGMIGKWHLGHLPEFMPNTHGFDYFFGTPYSNDMRPASNPKLPPFPLYRNEEVIERGIQQETLTKRYTEEAVKFIRENKEEPFFLYYPSNFPHVPLYASEDFVGKSRRGLYGDVVSELDWSVGEILKELKDLGIDDSTLVIFTSDNGPWLSQKEEGGSSGLLFEGKGSTYEGGMRVPGIFWWPGTIPARGSTEALGTTMDLLPTFARLAGIPLPEGKVLDGVDLMPVLSGQEQAVREFVYYYHRSELYAIRKGPWKAHFTTRPSYSAEPAKRHETPLLYNMEADPSEKYNVNDQYPEQLLEIQKEYKRHVESFTPAASIMEIKIAD